MPSESFRDIARRYYVDDVPGASIPHARLQQILHRLQTDELRMTYHRLEADFFAHEFHKTHDPWAAINASSHYRKCRRADDAHALLSLIPAEQQSPKIQAALYTTHGGV